MAGGVRPMLPSDYKLAPPPTNAYQTDLALAAAANSMAPMPMVGFSLSSVVFQTESVGSAFAPFAAQLIHVNLLYLSRLSYLEDVACCIPPWTLCVSSVYIFVVW